VVDVTGGIDGNTNTEGFVDVVVGAGVAAFDEVGAIVEDATLNAVVLNVVVLVVVDDAVVVVVVVVDGMVVDDGLQGPHF
jgi:hypothetical protein